VPGRSYADARVFSRPCHQSGPFIAFPHSPSAFFEKWDPMLVPSRAASLAALAAAIVGLGLSAAVVLSADASRRSVSGRAGRHENVLPAMTFGRDAGRGARLFATSAKFRRPDPGPYRPAVQRHGAPPSPARPCARPC